LRCRAYAFCHLQTLGLWDIYSRTAADGSQQQAQFANIDFLYPYLPHAAGHTPYSLNGKESGEGGCVRAVCCVDDADTEADTTSGCSSQVRMELFTSTITETELQSTPVPTVTAPRTPADAPAAVQAGKHAAGVGSIALAPAQTKSAAGQKAAQEAAAAAAPASSFSGDSSFTGFGLGSLVPAAAEEEGESTPPFFKGLAPAAADEEEESTPPFIGKTVSNIAAAAADSSTTSAASCEVSAAEGSSDVSAAGSSAVTALAGADDDVSSRARAAGAGVGGSTSSSSMLGLAATPRSHLKQPARVPVEGSR
jgi:hypothetical protein